MTPEIIMVFCVLGGAILLFTTKIIRLDLTALLVLVILVLTGLVQTEQALSGFSNPAVVTIWAMFILSTSLARTGIANRIGMAILRSAKQGGGRLAAILMTVAALLSAVMHNTHVTAIFLPITMEIAKRTKQPASRLLLPIAQGCLLGGTILLIGAASNLVVSDAMRAAGFTPLGIIDFAPGGLIILFLSVLYMGTIGWRFLPARLPSHAISYLSSQSSEVDLSSYAHEERFALLKIPTDSPLHGKTLLESRMGLALGLNILSIQRKKKNTIPAKPNTILENEDTLLALGRFDHIKEISQAPTFTIENDPHVLEHLLEGNIGVAEFGIAADFQFANKSISEVDFRNLFLVNVLAIRQQDIIHRTNLRNMVMKTGNKVLVQGAQEDLARFEFFPHFRRLTLQELEDYQLEEVLLTIRIPEGSSLVNLTLTESRLGEAYGLTIYSLNRDGQHWSMSEPDLVLESGDLLLVGGRPADIEVARGLSTLEIEENVTLDQDQLEEGPLQLSEVMLSPYCRYTGKTLKDINFRKKFGLSVLAIWRGERVFRSNLGNIPLNYGDALLCYGEQEKYITLATEKDFVVLNIAAQEKPRIKKASVAAFIMVSVILTAILFQIPISIAAIAGCVLMAISGSLTMDEAYQGIDWKSVFLIAAMLPLGIAMQQTGAAELLGKAIVELLGQYGPSAILAGFMILSMLGTQAMPSPVVAIIISPVALSTALSLDISPYPFMLGIAYALAAALISPVTAPANVLVMSPGGYRFSDYVRHGLPISMIVILVSLLVLPLLFPY